MSIWIGCVILAAGAGTCLAALARTRHHGCATCSNACMLETNAIFALQPRVLASLARRYLRSRDT